MPRHFGLYKFFVNASVIISGLHGFALGQVREVGPSTQSTQGLIPGYTVTKSDLLLIDKSLRAPTRSSAAEGVNETGLREGIPEYILDYAERHRPHPVQSSRLGALEMITRRMQSFFNDNHIASIDPDLGPTDVRYGETIVVATKRPALFLCKNAITDPIPTLWYERVNNLGFTGRLASVSASVGLIRIKWPYEFTSTPVGTGFVVGKGIIATNRHVAAQFAEPDGSFKASRLDASVRLNATVDFCGEKCDRPAQICNIVKVLYMSSVAGPDLALLKIESLGGGSMPPPLDLELAQPKPLVPAANGASTGATRRVGELVYVVGYPFHDKRVPEEVEYDVFGNPLGVKRVAFGQLQEASGLGNHGLLVYDCSTLGGCSGSPLVDLDTGKVWGVHFAGVFKQGNYAWPIWKLCEDPAIRQLLHPS